MNTVIACCSWEEGMNYPQANGTAIRRMEAIPCLSEHLPGSILNGSGHCREAVRSSIPHSWIYGFQKRSLSGLGFLTYTFYPLRFRVPLPTGAPPARFSARVVGKTYPCPWRSEVLVSGTTGLYMPEHYACTRTGYILLIDSCPLAHCYHFESWLYRSYPTVPRASNCVAL